MFSLLRGHASKIFYGWWIVAICSLRAGLGMPLMGAGRSVLFLPVSQDLRISRTALSLIFSIGTAEGAIEGVIVGWLIDRLGPRLMMVIGAAVAGIGYLLLSQVNSYVAFAVIFLSLISVGTNASLMRPHIAAMNTWFKRRRALTMSIVMASPGVGAVIIPVYSWVVLTYGWQTGAMLTGLIFLLLLAPLALGVRRSPEHMGLKPDGGKAEERMAESGGAVAVMRTTEGDTDFPVKDALRTSAFWLMTFSSAFRFFALGAITLHFIPILVWKGLEQGYASLVMGFMLSVYLVSRPLAGWLGDMFSKPKLLVLGMALGSLSPLLLLYGSTVWTVWIAALLYGLSEGFPPVHQALLGDYFGRRNFATLSGVSHTITSPFQAASPLLAGWMYDRSQTYSLVLWLMFGLFVIGAVLYLLLRQPRQLHKSF